MAERKYAEDALARELNVSVVMALVYTLVVNPEKEWRLKFLRFQAGQRKTKRIFAWHVFKADSNLAQR
jgi:hypothetical protein